jgi:hypothetical protein
VNLPGIASALPYTIATCGSLTGTFTSVPVGTTVVYEASRILITAVGTPFQSWVGGHFPGVTDLAIIGRELQWLHLQGHRRHRPRQPH